MVELKSLQKYQIKPGNPNFLIGVAGNGISTTLQQEVYSLKPQRVYYLNYFNFPDPSEQAILLEFINCILNAFSLPPLRREDVASFHNPFEIFTLGAELIKSAKVEPWNILIIFDEFQRLYNFSNAFFFTLDKILTIGQIAPAVNLTSVLIADEFINPRKLEPTEGLGKLFYHHFNFEVISVPSLVEIQVSGLGKVIAGFDANEQKQIYALAGGVPSLLISVAHVFKDYQNDLDRYLQDYQVEWKIHEIWESLGQENRELLLRVDSGQQRQIVDDLQRKFLESSGILKPGKSSNIQGAFGAELLKEYVGRQKSLAQASDPSFFELSEYSIYLPDLTPQQETVLKFLGERVGGLVSREEIGQAIWGSNYIDKYSDYAIDKLLSKLRRALKKYKGIDIETSKGRGYILLVK